MSDFGFQGSSQLVDAANISLSGATPTGVAANTKSAWVELSASTTVETMGFSIAANHSDASAGTQVSLLLDIGIGAAGSETVIVEGIAVDGSHTSEYLISAYIPLHISAGSRVAIRGQASATSENISVKIKLHPKTMAGLTSYQIIESYGVNNADSGGVTVTTPSSGTSAWQEIVASTNSEIKSLGLCFTCTGSASDAIHKTEFAVGAAGSEIVVIPGMSWSYRRTTARSSIMPNLSWLPVHIPAGSRISARTTFGGGSTRSLDVILLGAR